jgi:hypothetical protein
VWNNLHITADIIFRPTMTHVVISLRGQLDIQRQTLRHDVVAIASGINASATFEVISKLSLAILSGRIGIVRTVFSVTA